MSLALMNEVETNPPKLNKTIKVVEIIILEVILYLCYSTYSKMCMEEKQIKEYFRSIQVFFEVSYNKPVVHYQTYIHYIVYNETVNVSCIRYRSSMK